MPCEIRPLGVPENGHKKIAGGRTEDEAFWRTWNTKRYGNNDAADRPTNPITFMSIKVSAHGRVPRPYLQAMEDISAVISPLKFYASLFLNWSVLKQLEEEGCLLHDCLGKKTFMRAMKMLARGPDNEWVRRTRELARDVVRYCYRKQARCREARCRQARCKQADRVISWPRCRARCVSG